METAIVAHFPELKRGFAPTVPLVEIVNAILYKIKTRVHWRLLPVKASFDQKALCWDRVYYHYRKCCLLRIWKDYWINLVDAHQKDLNLSNVDLDGNHIPAIRGGYYNDLFDIKVQFEVVTSTLEEAIISVDGLFMNADERFDCPDFRSTCIDKEINANNCFNKRKDNCDRDGYFDEQLYRLRYGIEHTNA